MDQRQTIPLHQSNRPRLRVKPGCLSCLKRRKKCDENRPYCQACVTLGLVCHWRGIPPTFPQPHTHSSARRPTSLRKCVTAFTAAHPDCESLQVRGLSPPPPKVIAGHSGFRSTQDQSMFSYFVSFYAPSLCDGRAHPFYRDSSHCLSLALQVPWLMDAMLAVAEHHHALRQNTLLAYAMQHYAQAVRGLRESITSMRVPEDPVVCAVIFAGIFGERLSDAQCSSLTHFYASFQFLRMLSCNLEAGRASKSRMAFLRMQTDMTIYHIATRAIFESDKQEPSEPDRLEDLEAYWQIARPGPQDVEPFPSSSFLGPVPALYMLVYRITLLSRNDPLSAAEVTQAQQCRERINETKAILDATSALHFRGEDVANPFLAEDCTPRLYILALEILLAKITDPSVAYTDVDIQNWVSEANELLSKPSFVYAQGPETGQKMSYHLAEPLCWPMLVIGVAILQKKHRDTFEKVLGDLWDVTYNSFVKRVSATLKDVCELRGSSKQIALSSIASGQLSCDGRRTDGLDILLRRGEFLHRSQGSVYA